MSRLPRIAATLLVISLSLPAAAEDNPLAQWDSRIAQADSGGRDADWQDAQGNWIVATTSAWPEAMLDLFSICTEDTMRYCICLANRLPKRMTAREYLIVVSGLKAGRPEAITSRQDQIRAFHEESGLCARKTGVSP